MKHTQSGMSKKVIFCVAKLADKSIVANANSTSCGIFYQPKAPKDLKNFRKF